MQDQLTALEPTLIEDFTLAGFQNATINGFTIYRAREFFCKVKEGVDKEKVIDAFRLAGLSHALGGPNYQTMRSLAREWSEAEELPPAGIRDLIDIGENFRLRARKA